MEKSDLLLEKLRLFFKNEKLLIEVEKKGLILACSGGPDSLSLFFLMSFLQKEIPFKGVVAHVNHNWRASSTCEAKRLAAWVEDEVSKGRNWSFECLDLKPPSSPRENNLEEKARLERLKFLETLSQKYQTPYVLFGHHKKDHMEWIFKSVMEGKELFNLKGIQKNQSYKRLTLLRPFLETSKEDLQESLRELSKQSIEDPSNHDLRFLRARLRTEVFPLLEQKLKREIEEPLRRLSSYAQELDTFLESETSSLISQEEKGPFGVYYPLFTEHKAEFIWRYFFRKVAARNERGLSYHLAKSLAAAAINNQSNFRVNQGDLSLVLDKGYLFVLKLDQLNGLNELSLSQEGVFSLGPWRLELKEVKSKSELSLKAGWKHNWSGEFSYLFPKKDFTLVFSSKGRKRKGQVKNLGRSLSNQQVPLTVRELFPYVQLEGDEGVYEFLSGKTGGMSQATSFWKLSFKLRNKSINQGLDRQLVSVADSP